MGAPSPATPATPNPGELGLNTKLTPKEYLNARKEFQSTLTEQMAALTCGKKGLITRLQKQVAALGEEDESIAGLGVQAEVLKGSEICAQLQTLQGKVRGTRLDGWAALQEEGAILLVEAQAAAAHLESIVEALGCTEKDKAKKSNKEKARSLEPHFEHPAGVKAVLMPLMC